MPMIRKLLWMILGVAVVYIVYQWIDPVLNPTMRIVVWILVIVLVLYIMFRIFASIMRAIIRSVLVIAVFYMVYRLIDPIGAENLLDNIQNHFQREIVEQDVEPDSDDEQIQVDADTGTIMTGVQDDSIHTGNVVYTGTIDTGSILELDYILSDTGSKVDDNKEQEKEETTQSQPEQDKTSIPAPTPPEQPTVQQQPTQRSLSEQDKQDLRNLLNAIVE